MPSTLNLTLRLIWLSPLLLLPLDGYARGASALDWWVIGGAITLFVPLFWWTCSLSGVVAALPLTGMTLLGVVLTPLQPAACLFFGYAGAF